MPRPDHPKDAARRITALTDAFCSARLDAEYKKLCRKLIRDLTAAGAPLERGKPEVWAASVVHALGMVNYLFAPDSPWKMSVQDVTDYFKVGASTISPKSVQIREQIIGGPMDLNSLQYLTRRTAKIYDPVFALADTLAELPPKAKAAVKKGAGIDFIDGDHEVMEDYYELCERASNAKGAVPGLETALRKLIERDPDFFDTYLMLRDLLRRQGKEAEADALLEEAASRALRAITGPGGRWPARLEWGWLENRHIIRALLNRALTQWERGETEMALELFRNLLRTCPGDNIGARNYLLAMREGMTWSQFEARFNEAGYYTSELFDWFDANSAKFPEEFDEWKKAVEEG